MSILETLRKTSTIKQTDILADSKFFNKKDMVQTSIPMINVALSGSLDGGITPGLTLWCGPSKHFKTFFCLIEVAAYLKKYPEAVCIFYDSEFGAGKKYFESMGIDTKRVIHTPISDIEQLKFDVTQQLDVINRGDKVIIFIDSIGNLASKKEVDDAMDGKSVGDMTRAKQLKSVFRIITPHLTIKDIPMVVVNHTYQTQEMYSKSVVSGGCVVEGTMIQTPSGLKSVENFNVGEQVITLDGPKIVTHVWNPDTLEDGKPECYEIVFEDGYKVTCSDKHKFLVDGLWIEAENLTLDMDVSVV
jgi:RecA/RadA recombinase